MYEISQILLVHFNASATVNIEIGELARGPSMAFVNRLPRHCAIRNSSQVNIQSVIPVNKLFVCLTLLCANYFVKSAKKTVKKLLFQLNTGGDVLERVSESKKISRVKLSCSSNNKLFQNGQRVWRGTGVGLITGVNSRTFGMCS